MILSRNFYEAGWMMGISSVLLLTWQLQSSSSAWAFVPSPNNLINFQHTSSRPSSRSSSIAAPLFSTKSERGSDSTSKDQSAVPKRKKQLTLKELREEIKKKPSAFLLTDNANQKKKSKYRRTRKRVENPQQTYMYAKQRQALEREGNLVNKSKATITSTEQPEGQDNNNSNNEAATAESYLEGDKTSSISIPVALAKECGLVNPAAQHCDPLVDQVDPQILGQVRVGDDPQRSGSFVYIIQKPPGWAILGEKSNNKATPNSSSNNNEEPLDNDLQPQEPIASSTSSPTSTTSQSNKRGTLIRLEITDVDGSADVLEYSENDLLAIMTPEEIAEYKAEQAQSGGAFPTQGDGNSKTVTQKVKVRVDNDSHNDDEGDYGFMDGIDLDTLSFDEREILELLSPSEFAQYEEEVGPLPKDFHVGASEAMDKPESDDTAQVSKDNIVSSHDDEPLDPKTAEIISKIEARISAAKSSSASVAPISRPSVVAWLKDLKTQEGNPMKGGNYWTAVAGATNVDDSGIVILCPKEHVDDIFVDYMEYVAVVGNNNNLAPKQKGVVPTRKEDLSMETISTVRRGRGDDTVQTVKVMVPEKFSSCNSIVQACQQQFQDGIRGDPAGNPLGRLASRRLIHCSGVSVSSLLYDESVEIETEGVPDDIAILAERRNQHQYKEGSFLGRSALKKNPLTTAYREINGAADGFPGWTVDRYDKWLFVQHNEKMPRGPLPSIHDGNTAGVYYLPASQDRSAMGSSGSISTRPRLLEGQPAADIINVLENGITYQVSLDKDLSTGLFLDQRPQRAWLARNCNEDTHVLNCFAHCGGFSIAAATAGASTTSIDLNKKWLDRIEPQLRENGIDFSIRHDCIYGDCFEWLEKLAKRGERYDIVILDPPSASVGGKKKKRWSIKNDMPELVSLVAQVVKKGGLLWTTTNSASVSPVKFALLCRRGLEEAGVASAKLERIVPMPHDFPSVGPQPVKNFVWRLP